MDTLVSYQSDDTWCDSVIPGRTSQCQVCSETYQCLGACVGVLRAHTMANEIPTVLLHYIIF